MTSERFRTKAEARQRVVELYEQNVIAKIYKGHRDFVVQYEQPPLDKPSE